MDVGGAGRDLPPLPPLHGPQLRASLRGAGFEPTRVTYFNTLLFPPIAAIRLVRRLLPKRGPAHSDFELNEPGRVNELLARAFGLEAGIVRRVNLPFGVSVAALGSGPCYFAASPQVT